VIRLAGIVLAAAVLAAGGATLSGADFVSGSAAPGNVFTAASDFNTVAVSIVDPGTPLRGTKTLQAIATSEREIDHVTFQSAPAGTTTWADACTTAPTVSLTDPGAVLTGTVSLAATASDTGGVSSVAFERSVAGANTWVSICTDNATPVTCSFATTALADGFYDLRALATDAAGDQGTSVVAGVRLENTTPTGTDVQTGNGGAPRACSRLGTGSGSPRASRSPPRRSSPGGRAPHRRSASRSPTAPTTTGWTSRPPAALA
jgi:Bacterial Ig domain